MKLNLKHFPQLRSLLEQVGMFRESAELEAANNVLTINGGEVRVTFPKYARTLHVVKQNGSRFRVVDWYDLVELTSIYELASSSERTTNSKEVSDLINTYFPHGSVCIDITLRH